jgi:hypothetical protein
VNFVVLDNFDFRIDSHFYSTIFVVMNVIFNEFHNSILKYINSHIVTNDLIIHCNYITKNALSSSIKSLKFDNKWKFCASWKCRQESKSVLPVVHVYSWKQVPFEYVVQHWSFSFLHFQTYPKYNDKHKCYWSCHNQRVKKI